MQELPRLVLQIVLFNLGDKGGIGEVLKAGRIVCHDVVRSWEVGGEMAVAEETLVGARIVAQESGWSVA